MVNEQRPSSPRSFPFALDLADKSSLRGRDVILSQSSAPGPGRILDSSGAPNTHGKPRPIARVRTALRWT